MRFVRSVLREILRHYALAVLTLLVISIIEKFDYIARFAIEFGLSLRSFILLQIAALPSILDLMLPIATVVTVYVAVLNVRERREFIALASAGAGPRLMAALAVSVATAAALASLALSAFIKPASNYAFRREYERAVAELIARAPKEGRFFHVPGKVIQVLSGTDATRRRLRVFEFDQSRLTSVYLADCTGTHVTGPILWADDCAALAYSFKTPKTAPPDQALAAECPDCTDERADLDLALSKVRQASIPFDLGGMLTVDQRPRIEERDIIDLLRSEAGRFASPENARLGIKALLLALTNVFAVACALAAVAFTTLKTRLIAPTAGIVTLLGGVIAAGSDVALPAALLTPAGAVGLVLAVAAACVGLIVVLVHLLLDRLTAPRMRRA